MIRIRPLFLSLLFVAANVFAADGCFIRLLESTNRHVIVEARFDSMAFIQRQVEGEWKTTIELPGAGSVIEPGAPRLPMTTVRLGIPAAAHPSLMILSEQAETKNIGAVEEIQKGDLAGDIAPEFYPQASVELGADAFIRDQRVLHVFLFPVRYQARTQTAQIYKTIQFKIDFNINAESSTFTFNATSDSVLKGLLDNYENSRAWRQTPRPSLQKTSSEQLPMATLFVKNDGVYKVTGYDLLQHGVDIRSIDPRTLALSNKGRPVPIIVEGKNDGELNHEDRIIFIGRHNEGEGTHLSLFSDTNVYQLTWGGQGMSFTELPASPNGGELDTLDSAPFSIHFEKDLRYERMVGYDNGDDDHWFWEKLMNDERVNFPVSLPGLTDKSRLHLTAEFHGLTKSSEVEMNHHVFAYMDDQEIGEAYGSQDNPFSLYGKTFSVPGTNSHRVVHFDLPLDNPKVFADFVFLNWFKIDYDRSLRTRNDQLVFDLEPRDHRLWRLTGFSSDQVYLLTDTGYRLVFPKIKSRANGTELLVTFPSTHAARLYAVHEKKLQSVLAIKMDEPSDLSSSAVGADYVVITHAKFRHSAERLADYRAGQGLRTLVVDIQDIYDEFSHSLYDPRAIKRFIAHAYNTWIKPEPLYFVLLGDATYFMDKDAAAENSLQCYVPSYMVNTTSFGMTSSDNYFACISGDDALPDVYLGRLPANTIDDAEAMIDKIISYETKGQTDEWRRHVTLASGNGEFFDMSAQNLVDNYLPKWLVTSRLSTEFQSPYFNTTEDFVSWINSGQNIINFLVHGSGEQIADADLFDKDDMLRLNNEDRYAFAVTMSCYIGHFDHPEKNSLGEVLFTTPNKGIMGMFGSAGKSYLYSDYYFNAAVFDGIYNKGWRTLGEITTNAKYELIAKTKGFWEPVHNFLLIGDPATRLNVPEKELELHLSKKVLAEGDVLRVSGTMPSQSGTLYLEAIGDMDSVIAENKVHIQNGQNDIELFALTPHLRKKWGEHGGRGAVRAFFNDEHQSAFGLASFSVIQPLFSHIGILPEKPVGFQPVHFVVNVSPTVAAEIGGIQSLMVEWSTDETTWHTAELKNEDARWMSTESLSHEEGTTVFYKVKVQSSRGVQTETEMYEYNVLYKPDLYVDANITYSGTNQKYLRVTVKNRGESDAVGANLDVLDRKTNQPVVTDVHIPSVVGRSDTTLSIPVPELSAGQHELELVVDPDNRLAEEEEDNNRSVVLLNIASPDAGSNGRWSFESFGCAITIPANSVTHHTSVRVKKSEKINAENMQGTVGLVPLKTNATEIPMIFELELADSTMTLAGASVSLNMDMHDSTTAAFLPTNGVRIYGWSPAATQWKGLVTQRAEDQVSAALESGTRIFALFGSADTDAPEITFSVLGQHFADGDVVPALPTFAISIEDASAIDRSSSGIQLWLDDVLLNESDYVLTVDVEKAGLVQISFSPDELLGEHVLKVVAADVNANVRTQEVTFSIAENFGLDFIANHPNPFVDETTFAFSIRDMASHVDLNIYTVSGRLIRSFEFTDISGYNEVDWDGADSDGNDIANGVYYLKFSARKGDEKIERIERLAKLK